MFLSTNEASIVGKYFSIFGEKCFGEYYRWIFSPIVGMLGVMILIKKASWSAGRFGGLILFFLSVTSLVGINREAPIGFFDLHAQAITFFGRSTTILGLVVIFFISIYMTVRISYRNLLSKVRENIPHIASTVKNTVLPPDDEEDEEVAPTKKAKADEVYRKKAEELERKLANIQKSKEGEKK